MMKQAEFTYFTLGKAFKKQTKTTEDKKKQWKLSEENGKKQVEALQTLKHTNQRLRITGVIPEDLSKKAAKEE